jgi:solute carrier family 12 (sodium/potassium/chloride transporter), member 2
LKLPFSSTPAATPGPVVPGKPGGLGAFGGVFTPSILTILGVIMYLRFGWVVGNVGLLGTLAIVTLATSITFLTAFSISSIATDQTVRTGGAYYMISRSLGIEAGGAIGIPLFFAQGLSVALYTVGFAESVSRAFPMVHEKAVGLVTSVAVALLAITSARVAVRAQYFIMGAIALSLLSLFFGGPAQSTAAEVAHQATHQREGFWIVFAVFFPAVTGIMAGVNMSGDLKDPSSAIPRGTFAAIGVGYLIYMTIPVVLYFRAETGALLLDPLVMRRMAVWGDAILVGVWGATLSSAVGSILGAPRVLQALARDGILPRSLSWLGTGSGEDDTPRAGTLATMGLALTAVWFGNLNVIAPVLTMFFLTTYGVLNVSAGIEKLLKSPSFRPSFSVHWSVSLLGAGGCASIMFLINPGATIVAGVFVLAIFLWLQRRGMEAAWGDVRMGIWLALIQAGLSRLQRPVDPRNWRPHLLVLTGAPTRRWHLVELAANFTHNRGILTIATVLGSGSVTLERRRGLETGIQDFLLKRGVQALVRVVSAPDPFSGSEQLVETYGLGNLVPNTILLGDTKEEKHQEPYCRMVERFYRARRNVLIVREDADRGFGDRKVIDIWWGGLQGNGALMLILAYLLQSGLQWRGARVRLKMVVPTADAVQRAQENLSAMAERTRTGADTKVLAAEGRPFFDLVRESSRDADLVFMGIARPDKGGFRSYYAQLRENTEGLPSTVFVLAAEEIVFREVLFRFEHPLDLMG